MLAREDERLKNALEDAALVLPDGIGRHKGRGKFLHAAPR
jgi:UDP-N-acetyl-D-mannosaminuronic acid transferase (WecB/TagA/CpsF family)